MEPSKCLAREAAGSESYVFTFVGNVAFRSYQHNHQIHQCKVTKTKEESEKMRLSEDVEFRCREDSQQSGGSFGLSILGKEPWGPGTS